MHEHEIPKDDHSRESFLSVFLDNRGYQSKIRVYDRAGVIVDHVISMKPSYPYHVTLEFSEMFARIFYIYKRKNHIIIPKDSGRYARVNLTSSLEHSPIIKQLLVIRHSGYKIEDLVVGHGVRPEDLPGEFVDPPGEDQIPDRNKVQHDCAHDRQDHRQAAQIGDREVEEILHSLAQAGYVADRVLNCLRDFLDRL